MVIAPPISLLCVHRDDLPQAPEGIGRNVPGFVERLANGLPYSQSLVFNLAAADDANATDPVGDTKIIGSFLNERGNGVGDFLPVTQDHDIKPWRNLTDMICWICWKREISCPFKRITWSPICIPA